MVGGKKPKYRLELNLHELSNIPQVSGHCYIDLQIRDSKRVKSLPFKGLSFMNGSHSETSDSDKEGLATPGSSSSVNVSNNAGVVSSSSGPGGNISLTTSKHKIQNFECPINLKVACNLKFGVKRRENLIADKFLLMRIFYLGEKHKEFGVHAPNSNKIELGRLDINLAEYLNFNEPVTSKYLLKDSKINSLLSTTIHLSELPSNMDFSTQLEITENKKSLIHHDTKLDQSKPTNMNASKSEGTYNIPQFERKNVFGGLNDVIGSENRRGDSKSRNSNDSFRRDQSPLNREDSTKGKSKKSFHPLSHQESQIFNQQNSQNSSSHNYPSSEGPYTNASHGDKEHNTFRNDQTILIDPIVNDLYKKILECTWDPKLHTLLDYTPEACVNSIFDGTFDELRQKLKEDLHDDDDEGDEVRGILGLVNECNYRDDLKSWTVHGEVN